MASAFAPKRKARKIHVDEDGDEGSNDRGSEQTSPVIRGPSWGGKTSKKSSLRQSIAFDDDHEKDGDQKGNLMNKPTLGRSSSSTKKKKLSSKLSFGAEEIISGDVAEVLDDGTFAPKKALGRRAIDPSILRKSLPCQGLSFRSGDDGERPTYSQEYLNELKNLTPITPKGLKDPQVTVERDDCLDSSELEGATVLDTGNTLAIIPTEAEIREKKERRARLAHEKDYISLNTDSSDGRISLPLGKKKTETRLVREDEDFGEGFDEFVDDGRIALGKKQEREARHCYRKEIADMIKKAEGSSDEESDDSEAERRAAYEIAQTRAGMDGLHKHSDHMISDTPQVPARIIPLPVLSECLERLQNNLNSTERELAKRQKKLQEAKQERLEIATRETEVQQLLKQAGEKYAALKADARNLVGGSSGMMPTMVDRGLESFCSTLMARSGVEDGG